MKYKGYNLNIGGRDYVCESLIRHGPDKVYEYTSSLKLLWQYITGSKRKYYIYYEVRAVILVEDGVYPQFSDKATFNFNGKSITLDSSIKNINENRVEILFTQNPDEIQFGKD